MANSSNISFISGKLSNPADIQKSDKFRIDELVEQYPYFLPARFLESAYATKFFPESNQPFEDIHSFSCNWIHLCDFLDVASGKKEPKKQPEPVKDIDGNIAIAITNTENNNTPVEEIVNSHDAANNTKETGENIIADSFDIAIDFPTTDEELNVATIEENIKVANEDTATIYEQVVVINLTEEDSKIELLPVMETEVAEIENSAAAEMALALQEDELDDAVVIDEEFEVSFSPVFAEDYFLHQGIDVPNEVDAIFLTETEPDTPEDNAKELMVMMSFSEWLLHYKTTAEQKKEELEEKKSLKMHWQKEKLARALDEDEEEIPEGVFEMAMNSITQEDDMVSESLAEIYAKQSKFDLATNMYRKLSLLNPEKSSYFAHKIEEILKNK